MPKVGGLGLTPGTLRDGVNVNEEVNGNGNGLEIQDVTIQNMSWIVCHLEYNLPSGFISLSNEEAISGLPPQTPVYVYFYFGPKT